MAGTRALAKVNIYRVFTLYNDTLHHIGSLSQEQLGIYVFGLNVEDEIQIINMVSTTEFKKNNCGAFRFCIAYILTHNI